MASTSDNSAPRSQTPVCSSAAQLTPPLSPTNTIIPGPTPASPLTPVDPNTTSADCCVVLGDGVSQGYTSCPEHTGRRRRTIFGITLPGTRFQTVNDPFDYEQKYTEAEPYKEMGDGGRIWKTYVEESIKVDTNQVADWTDALDVLLVFAGLFSAVVSSFVSQTYQNLVLDHSEVTSYLVYESITLQRAADENIPLSTIPRSELAPNSTSDPSLSDVCVNGLWFTSLTLSLTTALIAVLTKQWIHQYMSFSQTGGPRERTQLRQSRADNFDAWNVPVIIGLLPVMMHVALAVFLAGLIIFLHTLSNPIMGAISFMAFIALCAYVASNLLPVFKASCPYITPLTHYAYRLVYHIHRSDSRAAFRRLSGFLGSCWRRYFRTGVSVCIVPSARGEVKETTDRNTSSMYPPSLREAERQMVRQKTYIFEARAASWLLTASSNSSIHRVVLQALSSVPLHAVPMIEDIVGRESLQNALCTTLAAPEYSDSNQRAAYERLTRSLIRFSPGPGIKPILVPQAFCQDDDFLPLLVNTDNSEDAAQFIRRQILSSHPSTAFDAPGWLEVLANALEPGMDWLDIGSDSSEVWQRFTQYFFQRHMCADCAQRAGSVGEVHSFQLLGRNRLYLQRCYLNLIEDPEGGKTTTEQVSFKMAVEYFMVPSLSYVVRRLAYPSSCNGRDYKDIPNDIHLHLAMLESEGVQKTSSSSDVSDMSTFAQVLTCIHESIGVKDARGACIHHPNILRPTFLSLTKVISCTFASGTLSLRDRKRLLRALFRTVSLDSQLRPYYVQWMTSELAASMIDTMFADSSDFLEFCPFIADALECNVRSQCTAFLPELYSKLCRMNWIRELEARRFGGNYWVNSPTTSNFYHFATAAFVEGVALLKDDALDQTIKYIREPPTLLTLCKVMILSDVQRRAQLQVISTLVQKDLWNSCLTELHGFLKDAEIKRLYERQLSSRHPYSTVELTLTHEPFEKLPTVLDSMNSYEEPYEVTVPPRAMLCARPAWLRKGHRSVRSSVVPATPGTSSEYQIV